MHEGHLPPATDANLDNLAWLIKQAASADPSQRLGVWVQMARYVPAVLNRLHQSEAERNAVVAGWWEMLDQRHRLLMAARKALSEEVAMRPDQVIACLQGKERSTDARPPQAPGL
jgi:hypothetical protein